MISNVPSIDSMASNLPESKIQEYEELFSYFDRDGGGSIGADELGQVMQTFGWNPTDSDLRVVG